MALMNGARILIESLAREGAEVVFGYPGGVTIPVYDVLYDHNLRHILVRHEENAAFAASAGIELFQRRLMNSTPDAAPLTLRGTVPGTADEFEVQARFAGLELSLPQVPGANLAGAHFDVFSIGRSAASAIDRQRAAVMLVIDSPEHVTALDCAPLAPPACHERGRVERLAWHRVFEP